jgi:hypothetical protein
MSNPLDSRYRAMKKLPILLCIFLLSACAPSEVPSDKLVERNGITYEINSQRPFTGVSTEYQENGQLAEKVNWVDGEVNGLAESYHENGQLAYKGNFKDGKFNGLSKWYHENGQLMKTFTHKDGRLHGLWESYDENGQEQDFSPMCYQNGEKADISKCKSL